MQRLATAGGGHQFIPRIGQEVLVGFLGNDIDRPVVIGTVYNGVGNEDAPHNRIGSGAANATGNAPAWFDGNEHAAVFTGFKSQALAESGTGSGGYQQLRLDDTPGQGRAQVSTTQQQTTLTWSEWVRRAKLMEALVRLAQGQSVLRVALDLGYGSHSAFSAMFRRVIGVAPSDYFRSPE